MLQSNTNVRSGALPLVCAYLGNILWGISNLFTRTALQTASPNLLLSFRFLFSAIIMTLPLLMGRARFSLKGKNWRPTGLMVASWLLYYTFESRGILYTNATIAGVVLAAVPVVAVLFAALFLKEYPSLRQGVFCLLPIGGVILITVAGSALGVAHPKGIFFLFLTCLSSAVYKTAGRKAAREFSAFERTYLQLICAAVFFTLSALTEVGGDLTAYLAPLSQPSFLVCVLSLSLLCSIAADLMVNYAIARMSVVKITSFGALSTLCSMFSGVLFLGEPMTPSLFLGAVLILAGIHQVTKP